MPLTAKQTARRIAARIHHDDAGFSMVVVMIAVMMLSMSALVSLRTVDLDQPVAREDLLRKRAYAAAESGLQAYVLRLTKDATYWTRCTGNNPTGTTTNGKNQTDGVNQWWNGKSSDPRRWVNMPDNSGQYTVEQLPANDNTTCNVNDPVGTMIDDATATFRVRVTGRGLAANGTPDEAKRSIIATFKRKSFLDYIYFTDLETFDPTLYPSRYAPGATITKENNGRNDVDGTGARSVVQWGNQVCAQYDYVKGPNGKFRKGQYFLGSRNQYAGSYKSSTGWSDLSAACSDTSSAYSGRNGDIRFADGDAVNGPFHSNDTPMICGNPDFGRSPGDAIETAAPGDSSIKDRTKSWRVDPSSGCGTATPDVNFDGSTAKANRGTWLMNQGLIQLPPTNQSLDAEASAAYTFMGNVNITLGTNTITVTGKRPNGQMLTNQAMGYPATGVVYVKNDSSVACEGYSSSDPYAARPGCGIVNVSGSYGQSLTIGAADDILITDHVRNAAPTKALLGLVAQNFIRVEHRTNPATNCNSSSTDVSGGYTRDLRIDAALLTLRHSFLVDNWGCGDSLGTLTITGAIAQKFRGPVATGSGKTTATGYSKDYTYDDRLRTLSPPKFLDPVKASWRLKMYQEQAPAT